MLIANLLVLVMMKMKAIWLLYTWADRKSTRLNSSHSQISYAVFCLKKKKITLVFAISAFFVLDRISDYNGSVSPVSRSSGSKGFSTPHTTDHCDAHPRDSTGTYPS